MAIFDRSSSSENYEQLKAKLLNLCSQGFIQTIMLTACNKGDGVTTTARNLASVLSSGSSARILLVELNSDGKNTNVSLNNNSKNLLPDNRPNDLSFPENIQNYLIQQEIPYLSTLNEFKQTTEMFALKDTPENFSVVTMKSGFECSSNLFQSDAFKALLDIFKSQYDYVIFDAPPVSASTGCYVLGAQVDGVILVLRSEHTRLEVAKNARHQLESAGAKVLGVIISMKKYYIPDFIYRRL